MPRAAAVNGVGPVAFFIGACFLNKGPKIDAAGQAILEGHMAVIGESGLDRGIENPIDRLQNRRRGAEGIGEATALKELPRFADFLLKGRAFAVQLLGVGPLERVDRLLFVAHDEKRPIHLITCASA